MATSLTAPKCAHCGAHLVVPAGTPFVVCQFCGTRFDAPRQGAPGFGPPQLQPGQVIVTAFGAGPNARGPGGAYANGSVPRIAYQPPASGFKGWMVALYVIPIMLFAGIGSVTSIVTSASRARIASGKTAQSLVSNPLEAASNKIMMEGYSEPPVLTQVNGDGVEDLIGRYTTYDYVNSKSRLFVGAFDGATFELLWSVGPIGDVGAETSVHYAVAGRNVFIADSRANLRVYDVATGTERKSEKLSDRVEHIFAAPGPSGDAWLKMSDKKDVSYDGRTASLKPAKEPAWMPVKLPFPDNFDCEMHFRNPSLKARCTPKRAVPTVPGFDTQNGLVEGDDGVAFGTKSPGTRTPMLAGFDPKTKKPRWSVPVAADTLGLAEGPPKVGDLVGGRVMVSYETVKGDAHVAAFDAKSGNRLWDVGMPKTTVDAMTVTASRVYVPESRVIHIYDAALGRALGTIGTSN